MTKILTNENRSNFRFQDQYLGDNKIRVKSTNNNAPWCSYSGRLVLVESSSKSGPHPLRGPSSSKLPIIKSLPVSPAFCHHILKSLPPC